MVINEWKDRKQTSRGLEEARLPHTATIHNTSWFNTKSPQIQQHRILIVRLNICTSMCAIIEGIHWHIKRRLDCHTATIHNTSWFNTQSPQNKILQHCLVNIHLNLYLYFHVRSRDLLIQKNHCTSKAKSTMYICSPCYVC